MMLDMVEMERKSDVLYRFEREIRKEDTQQEGKGYQANLRMTNGTRAVEKGTLVTVGGCVNWSSHCGTLYGVSQQTKKIHKMTCYPTSVHIPDSPSFIIGEK